MEIVNEISTSTKKSMKQRVITGIIMAVVMLPCLIFGDWLFVILVCGIVGVGLHEIIKCSDKKYPWYVVLILYIFTYSFVFWTFFQKDMSVQSSVAEYVASPWYDFVGGRFYMYDIRLSTMGVGSLFTSLFIVAIINPKFELKDVFYLFGMSLFIGFAAQSVLFLRFVSESLVPENFVYPHHLCSSLLFVTVAFGTMFNDIFAYFTGILFGKHKMNERVSPKKTWEGFFGGVILSTLFTLGFILLCDKVFNCPVLPGIFDAEHWYYNIFLGLTLSLGAVVGDLVFSLIKRTYGIKDFGYIFPGHGGVLDRFDSMLFTCMLAAILITFIYYNPVFGAFGI